MMNKLSNTQQRNQHGFSLIEVLISVLVFGVGILGLGGLQIASIKGSSNAHYRTTASILAMDLSDRMRSNLPGVRNGFYSVAAPIDCEALTVTRLCRSGACSAVELAAFDIKEVMCGMRRGSGAAMRREGGVNGLLPAGAMTVTCAGGACATLIGSPNTTHNITVSWNNQKTDNRQVNDDQSRSLTFPVIP